MLNSFDFDLFFSEIHYIITSVYGKSWLLKQDLKFLMLWQVEIHWSQKILARSHFFHSFFHRFFQFSQKLLKIIKCFIHHMKDLKSRYLILLKQKAWLSLKGSHTFGNETRTFFTKINFLAFGVELLLISNAESVCLF